MSNAEKRMLVASKNGDISNAKLIRETRNVWVLEVEKREVRVSKSDTRQRAFCDMSDALEWAGAEPELIEHFAALNAEKAAPVVQAQS